MVDLLPEEIQEFKRIVKEVKDIDLTDEEARDQSGRLIRFCELMVKNLTTKQKQK